MLEVARRRSSQAPFAVRFSVGDARSLDEIDQSFDVVRSERTLQWLPEPASVVAEFVRVLRSGGQLSLFDTDWSTLHLDVGNPQITAMVRDGLRVERNRPSNVGRRLAELATAAGCEVLMKTTDAQIWSQWNPDESPAPDGCFSMASLGEDLVEKGQLEAGSRQRVPICRPDSRSGAAPTLEDVAHDARCHRRASLSRLPTHINSRHRPLKPYSTALEIGFDRTSAMSRRGDSSMSVKQRFGARVGARGGARLGVRCSA